MIVLGISFLIIDVLKGGVQSLIPSLLSITVVFLFIYLIYYLGVFGGADAKAFIMIGLMVPMYPTITLSGYDLPLAGIPIHRIFALSVLGNCAFLSVIIAVLWVLLINLVDLARDRKMPDRLFLLFLGYRKDIEGLRDSRHLRLLDRYEEMEDGSVRKRYRMGGVKIDDDLIGELEKYAASGKIEKKVWVTPGIPLMISITAGFVVAVIWGDLIDILVRLSIGI
ncbi:MAG: peptidase A24 [Candidatus Syntrophoarchaeum caldarius]|uniref:Peptidase A24 n=1 Tax=Candidatus Syntropharchaeum caldarium TaxID=1838285 RepID=A0A1F2P7N8_9EURY|nr:MAG: peptidase A24 [Candidatus Syntrophoarchaeum caldarius]